MLKASGVTVVRAGRALVNRVDLEVASGELVGLIGPNGAGKSTLLDVLAGLVPADSGSVVLDNRELHRIADAERARLLAWVAQSGPVNWPLSVERIVTLGRRPHLGNWQKPTGEDRAAIDAAIAATDCEHLRAQDATTLSGGERTRMMLARALAGEPQILLADEPVAALDLKHQLQTMEVLQRFVDNRRGSLVVLHDLSLAARYCDRLYLMHQGAIVACGKPSVVLTEDHLRDVYEVEIASGHHGQVPWLVGVRTIDS
jgi:iron complex transport system ATP-binding protein